MTPGRDSQRGQQGAALLLMMIVVLVAATAVLVSGLNNNSQRTRYLTDTRAALAAARAALLDYATIADELGTGARGRLPCPDIDGAGGYAEGVAHAADCGADGVTVIGRVPWKTLGIPPPRDSSGSCIWYAVSGSHKATAMPSGQMVNADSNGHILLYAAETGAVLQGASPDERAVALLMAPMRALDSQVRSTVTGSDRQCSDSFDAAQFLEANSGLAVSNASVSGGPDQLESFFGNRVPGAQYNDLVATIDRKDIAVALLGRHDFDANVRDAGLAIARCLADYARRNPAGASDQRLPWPAATALTDYRSLSDYVDVSIPALFGRLPDGVSVSNSLTGNLTGRVLSDCDAAAVPAWTPEIERFWQSWKDHFYYAVAESRAPASSVPSTCSSCLTVNGSGEFAAIVLFAAARLMGQERNTHPDPETRATIANYLEGRNASNYPLATGSADFESRSADHGFNDRLFCVHSSLTVTEC